MLTTNEALLDDTEIQTEQIINLNRDFDEDRKRYSEKIFAQLTGIPVGSATGARIAEIKRVEALLKKIGNHFYASIMLARAISKYRQFTDFWERQIEGKISIYTEADVLPYIRNIGLDITGALFDVLILFSIMPDATMKRDFFFALLPMKKDVRDQYELAIESGIEKSL